MENSQSNNPESKTRRISTRKKVIVSQESMVIREPLGQVVDLPLVLRPAIKAIDLIAWAKTSLEFIETSLSKHGAILFRGFNIGSADEFEHFIKTVSREMLQYNERSSPRRQVIGNIYTSTDYPADQTIFLHNENSYQKTWPMKIFFFCLRAALEGGETPIADCRKVLARLDPQIINGFARKRVMYLRNFGDGFGLPWQTVFQTSDKAAVESYCREADIHVEWMDDCRLRTRQVRPAVAEHPRTGEMVWFNHAAFFHISTLNAPIREFLLREFDEADLPTNTYYGDGSQIEPSVLDEIRAAYVKEAVAFSWQEGDVLMLDNLLTAHSRAPFKGERRVLVGMAEPFSWQQLMIGDDVWKTPR